MQITEESTQTVNCLLLWTPTAIHSEESSRLISYSNIFILITQSQQWKLSVVQVDSVPLILALYLLI